MIFWLQRQLQPRQLDRWRVWFASAMCACVMQSAQAGERLVFGSFERSGNAAAFANLLSERFDADIQVAPIATSNEQGDSRTMYRVVSSIVPDGEGDSLFSRASAQGYSPWFWRGIALVAPAPATIAKAAHAAPVSVPVIPAAAVTAASAAVTDSPDAMVSERPPSVSAAQSRPDRSVITRTEFDLGLQSRSYAHRGLNDQSRWQPSISGRLDWFRSWGEDRHSLTVSPFLRIDGEDEERTHGDLREGFYSYIGDRSEWHVGARQVFWGVTEFKHLVDIVNQTDLVENIDGEDKLGQGMVQLSLSRDWGVLDLYLLTGHRERTFAGTDGRLRFGLPVASNDAEFESGAGRGRLDGAVRWSHYAGPLSWGLHHFSGTSRDPLLLLAATAPGAQAELVPYYQVIDQTGVDAQWLAGDWAWKLEAISRSGDGERYAAANIGFERTLVGVFGSRVDLGLVVEYLFDERGDEAHNTLFERDVAVGTRWARNDAADSQALLGVIWDTRTKEYVVSLEASRQLGRNWQLLLEGRAFAGAPTLTAQAQLAAFADGSAKSAFLQSDDFLQLEVRRFF